MLLVYLRSRQRASSLPPRPSRAGQRQTMPASLREAVMVDSAQRSRRRARLQHRSGLAPHGLVAVFLGGTSFLCQ
jgi:hypothetical protein